MARKRPPQPVEVVRYYEDPGKPIVIKTASSGMVYPTSGAMLRLRGQAIVLDAAERAHGLKRIHLL